MSEKYTPYTALAVANYFIGHVSGVTPLKLQKLVYFAHGWYLAFEEEPLIKEPVLCWDYGPVIKEVYDSFKKHGNQVITQKERMFDFSTGNLILPEIDKNDKSTIKLLNVIKDVYGNYTALELSKSTHIDESPWDTVRKQGGDIIDNEIIKRYFRKQLEKIRSGKAAKK